MDIIMKRVLADLPSVRAELAAIRDITYMAIPIRSLVELVVGYAGQRHQQNLWFIMSPACVEDGMRRISDNIREMRKGAQPPHTDDHRWSRIIRDISVLAMDPSFLHAPQVVTCHDPCFTELITVACDRPINVTKAYDILYRLVCMIWPDGA